MKKKIIKYLKWALAAFALLVLLIIFCNYEVIHTAKPLICKTMDEVPNSQAALVLGAKVFKNGYLANMTLDRANMGIALYRAGKVKKILVSGDHGHEGYDEVNTIRNYILKTGIPREDVFMDHAGFDTYSSMYRARDVFKVESLVVCTQQFHLDRAVFLGHCLGLKVSGIAADSIHYSKWNLLFSNIRESGARTKAWFAAKITHPTPHFLGDPIPISGDGRATEDK